MTPEDIEKEKFLNEVKELWDNKYFQSIFYILIWMFIIAIWIFDAYMIRDIGSILGAIIFIPLGVFFIYNQIKMWRKK